jgi:hypothetical protein
MLSSGMIATQTSSGGTCDGSSGNEVPIGAGDVAMSALTGLANIARTLAHRNFGVDVAGNGRVFCRRRNAD